MVNSKGEMLNTTLMLTAPLRLTIKAYTGTLTHRNHNKNKGREAYGFIGY